MYLWEKRVSPCRERETKLRQIATACVGGREGTEAAAAKKSRRGSLSLMTCNACDTGGDGDGKATKAGKGGKPRGFFCCNRRPLRR